jgi:LysM repeat protein
MKHLVCSLLVILVALVLISGCGPSAPSPVPPTQGLEAVASPTAVQVAQAAPAPTTALPSVPVATGVSSTGCNPPAGWSPYTVKLGDTVVTLAKQVNLKPEELMRSNCLASSLITVGDTLYLPMESCTPSPPEGWSTYVVRSGDTLFSLASTRDTTVSEVKRVNCLISDSLEVGKQLYLPPLVVVPPPAAPPVAAPVAPPVVQPPPPPPNSPFGQRSGSLQGFDLPAPMPNDPTFTPCMTGNGARISVESERSNDPAKYDLVHGQRAYYFACDLSDPTKLTAQMIGPTGTQSLPVLLYMPNPDLQMGTAQGVIDWTVPCDLPAGSYTLIIQDGTGEPPAHLTFNVTPDPTDIQEREQKILVVPEVAPAGTTFQVYYCGYPPNSNVSINLFYAVARLPNDEIKFRHATSWNVLMNAEGWAKEELASSPNDPGVVYYIFDDDTTLDGETTIRLIR